MTPVIYPGGHFTHCIDRSVYVPLPGGLEGVVTKGPASFGKATCDFLLSGKLVCMSPDSVCAMGTIVGLEDTNYGKSGFKGIDNDFSFNLLLAPFTPTSFWMDAINKSDAYTIRDSVASSKPQGWLIEDRSGTVFGLEPLEPSDHSPIDGYGVLWRYPGAKNPFAPTPRPTQPAPAPDGNSDRQNNLSKLPTILDGADKPDGDVFIALPVLHCECEGSRIYAVCQALAPFLDILSGKPPGSPGPSVTDVCHDYLGWIPLVGDVVCSIAELIVDVAMFPIAIAAALAAGVAWVAAQAYDDAFLTGLVKKQIRIGQTVVVQGRWCWDAGHAGHLELHPVLAIAIADGVPTTSDAAAATRLDDIRQRWCELLDSAPPPSKQPSEVGLPPIPGAELSPRQQATALAQLEPENQWLVHPQVDGCAPREPKEPDLR